MIGEISADNINIKIGTLAKAYGRPIRSRYARRAEGGADWKETRPGARGELAYGLITT